MGSGDGERGEGERGGEPRHPCWEVRGGVD